MFWPVPAVATEEGMAPRARRAQIPPAAAGLAWAVVATLACASVIRLEPNLVEEGLVVHVAQRLARGEHLYRDIVFFSGPLAFELLGPGMPMRIGAGVLVVVSLPAVWWLGRRMNGEL